jgi:hypothetical protein
MKAVLIFPSVPVLLLMLAMGGCAKKEVAQKDLTTNNGSGNPITAPVDYLGAVNQAHKTAIRQIDLASMKNAIQLFNGQEDRYPRDLNELAQKHYIQAVPELPRGSRFLYDPATGDLRVVRQ